MAYAVISASSSGNNELVAAVAGKRIRVRGYCLIAAAAVGAKFRSANTDLTGAMALAANGGAAPSTAHPDGLFQTAVGEALNVNLSGAVAVAGHLTYSLE